MHFSPTFWRRLRGSPVAVLAGIILLYALPSPASGWPLVLRENHVTVTLSEPSYQTWDYLRIGMDIPVRVEPSGEAPILCTLRATARTFAERSEQRVLLRDFQVSGVRVNAETQRSAVGDASPEALAETIGRLLAKEHLTVDLRQVVAAFAGKKSLPSVSISSETPRIFGSTKPAILVQFDGPPMWLPVPGTKLSQGVNTNWDMFYDNKDTFYYLLAGDLWLATHDLYSDEWVIPKTLPKEMRQVPSTSEFSSVRSHLPYKANPDRALPKVFYSEKAAELVVTDGEPQLEEIAGTPVSWVRNTDADLFYHSAQKRYFTVVAGRWFSAARLEDYWRAVNEPPAEFRQIPASHPRARVRAHIPGTEEAAAEALWAQVPQLAKVRRADAALKVDFAGKPQYVPIDGTSLLHVPNATVPVIAHAGTLYACYHAVWFQAKAPAGPWELASSLPQDIYRIPPRSSVFHLSFVRLVESDADSVTFGYTGGYENTFVHNGTVIYGTGYDHPPALQYGAYTYPVYFAQPATFGSGAWYDTERHVFLRGRTGYGPFGGFGATSRYNSVTSHYFRPLSLYGEDQSSQPQLAFQPYTGAYGKTSRTYAPYSVWAASISSWNTRRPQAPSQGVTIQVGTPVVGAPEGPGREADTQRKSFQDATPKPPQ